MYRSREPLTKALIEPTPAPESRGSEWTNARRRGKDWAGTREALGMAPCLTARDDVGVAAAVRTWRAVIGAAALH